MALRRLLNTYRYSGDSYPAALDLYRELQVATPDSLQYLLTDLFEDITLWELRAKGAQVEPTGMGAYRVRLTVEAFKVKADSLGRERRVPMDEFVDIGVFADSQAGERSGEVLYLRKHRVRSGEQIITVTVPRMPSRAGVDPYHKLMDRNMENNVEPVTQ